MGSLAKEVQTSGTHSPQRRGLTLLEMVLSIAILAGSMAILGELVRIGARAGSGARDLTEAQLLCESIMSEIVAGALEPDPITRAEIPSDPHFLYTIWLAATEEEGLVELRVTVEENIPDKKRPRGFSLVRWIPDPGIELPEEPPEEGSDEQPDEDQAEQEAEGGPTLPDGIVPSGPGGGGGPNGR